MSEEENQGLMEKFVSFAKDRGFIFQSSEIYGGIAGVYDYGPLGVELKRNFKDLFWEKFVRNREDMVGMDAGIIMNPKVWQASGHTGEGFADILYECKECHKRFRDDEIEGDSCPECGGKLTEPAMFNILVKTHLGPVEEDSTMTYLRGETAQGMFVNFKNVLASTRKKIPFGIAQIGKAFRNEITPKNFTFRTREFEQAEIEYFVKPKQADKYFQEWVNIWQDFFLKDLGLNKNKVSWRPHGKDELSHYSKATTDIEYDFPFGQKELAGVANRTDFDLRNHENHSGVDMKYFDEEKQEKYYPYIIEPTIGIDRALLALLIDSFDVVGSRDKDNNQSSVKVSDGKNEEIVLRLPKQLAPYKLAIFPLIKKEKKLVKLAKDIFKDLNREFNCFYDQSGSIGRRYRRQDEIGTPYCLTVDFDSLDDGQVTIRDRDTMGQERVEIEELSTYMESQL
jgi:glycyl-tRNA synthetase